MSETTTLRPGYEKPENKSFPQDWKVSQLYEACTFHQGGKLGITKSAGYVASGVPAYSAAGQDGYVGQVEFSNTDGVVLSAIGANCGRCFFASGNWTTLANVQAIIPSPSQLDAKYLYYRVNRESYWPRSGSAQPFIKPSDVRNCWVAHPPIDQQKIIASILDTLNTQIQKTEALIAKLEKVKEGLLHDLLTRGIDENGQLRPSPEQAPELYKDSPLGLIPREWVCDQLKWFVPTADYGISSSLSDSGEVPVLRMNNFQDGEASLGSLKFSPASSISGLTLQYGDVLFNRTNSIDHVGRTGIWRGQLPRVSFASYLVRLNPDQEKLSPEYLNFWLNLNSTKNMVKRYATPGVHQVNVNPTNLRKVYMAAPSSMKEQVKVVDALLGLNKKIKKEQHAVAKLKSEKTALMDDLLTGRVRVTPLLEHAETGTPA
ncbi:restriction endonuclease subunit S [Thioalkalivibrio sp. ALE23]|uniref:restriction endonuclease subunit S n=1 Tax=Thioalkalivibrio sp. ALE23 TaxID=1265495 RepID=UPI0003A469D1|nr:restriction endonuclease subunit S [Thioalkalivibrio sp. ALE23]